MLLSFSRADADIFVPDGRTLPTDALAAVTHLCVGAHQDDIEIMAYGGIVECLETPGKSFGGVIVTDGGGSPRAGAYSEFTDEQLRATRREEQRAAARLGKYAVQIQLSHPSAEVKAASGTAVREDLRAIFSATRAQTVYLHNPADKHDTHVAVGLRCLEALRALPREQRPKRVLGCAVWRDLEWLRDQDRIALESGRRPELAAELLRVFDSQISAKRYDLATIGRRLAHATFDTPRAADQMAGITWAMDLTPLVENEQLGVAEYTLGYVDRLRDDIETRIRKHAYGAGAPKAE